MNFAKKIFASIGFGMIVGLTVSVTIRIFFNVIPREKVVVIEEKDCPPTEIIISPEDAKEAKPKTSKEARRNLISKTKPIPIKGTKKGILTIDGDRIHVKRKDLDDLLTKDLQKVTKTAKILPYKVGGQVTGFRLLGRRSPSIWADMGLQKGDIFKSINGKPTTDVSEAIALLRSVRYLKEIRITLDRNGEAMTKTIFLHD